MDADDRFRHLQKKAPLLGRLFGGFFGFRVSGLGFIGAQHFRHFRPLAGVPFFLVCMEVTILFSNSGDKRNAVPLWGFPLGGFLWVPFPLALT